MLCTLRYSKQLQNIFSSSRVIRCQTWSQITHKCLQISKLADSDPYTLISRCLVPIIVRNLKPSGTIVDVMYIEIQQTALKYIEWFESYEVSKFDENNLYHCLIVPKNI